MITTIVSHWHCLSCEVEGRDPDPTPSCWNCGRDVVVTARPVAGPTIPQLAGVSDL